MTKEIASAFVILTMWPFPMGSKKQPSTTKAISIPYRTPKASILWAINQSILKTSRITVKAFRQSRNSTQKTTVSAPPYTLYSIVNGIKLCKVHGFLWLDVPGSVVSSTPNLEKLYFSRYTLHPTKGHKRLGASFKLIKISRPMTL